MHSIKTARKLSGNLYRMLLRNGSCGYDVSKGGLKWNLTGVPTLRIPVCVFARLYRIQIMPRMDCWRYCSEACLILRLLTPDEWQNLVVPVCCKSAIARYGLRKKQINCQALTTSFTAASLVSRNWSMSFFAAIASLYPSAIKSRQKAFSNIR